MLSIVRGSYTNDDRIDRSSWSESIPSKGNYSNAPFLSKLNSFTMGLIIRQEGFSQPD